MDKHTRNNASAELYLMRVCIHASMHLHRNYVAPNISIFLYVRMINWLVSTCVRTHLRNSIPLSAQLQAGCVSLYHELCQRLLLLLQSLFRGSGIRLVALSSSSYELFSLVWLFPAGNYLFYVIFVVFVIVGSSCSSSLVRSLSAMKEQKK